MKATYSVTVRDHIMVAHSLKGEVFGPAQQLHGATFTIDATFFTHRLDDNGIVIDIAWASGCLKSEVEKLNYRNLDDLDAFIGKNSTTENVAAYFGEQIDRALSNARIHHIHRVKITLSESHIAWASYEYMPSGMAP